MTDKEKRHQVEDREPFTEAQKEFIASKSDHCCAWCGKKVYFKYGATVDHFVPLKKGGTNEPENLVMMCEDCNQKKSSLVVPPEMAALHLKPEYYRELDEWFDKYIETYDFFSRGNFLACDMYQIDLYLEEVAIAQARQAMSQKRKKRNQKIDLRTQCITCDVRRAYPDDVDKLVEYYEKYLKKYKIPHQDKACINNIKFWMRFGTIYYIERKGEIQLMVAISMNKHGLLIADMFTYYSNSTARTMTQGALKYLMKAIMREQNTPKLHMYISILKADSLAQKIMPYGSLIDADSLSWGSPIYLTNSNYKGDDPDKDLARFYSQFRDIEDEVRMWLYDNDIEGMEWMVQEIVGLEWLAPKRCEEELPPKTF